MECIIESAVQIESRQETFAIRQRRSRIQNNKVKKSLKVFYIG